MYKNKLTGKNDELLENARWSIISFLKAVTRGNLNQRHYEYWRESTDYPNRYMPADRISTMFKGGWSKAINYGTIVLTNLERNNCVKSIQKYYKAFRNIPSQSFYDKWYKKAVIQDKELFSSSDILLIEDSWEAVIIKAGLHIEEEKSQQIEQETRLQVDEETRLQIEEEERLKIEEQRWLKIQDEKWLNIEEGERMKIEGEKRLQIAEEKRLRSEDEKWLIIEDEEWRKIEAEKRLKSGLGIRLKIEEENQLRIEKERGQQIKEEERQWSIITEPKPAKRVVKSKTDKEVYLLIKQIKYLSKRINRKPSLSEWNTYASVHEFIQIDKSNVSTEVLSLIDISSNKASNFSVKFYKQDAIMFIRRCQVARPFTHLPLLHHYAVYYRWRGCQSFPTPSLTDIDLLFGNWTNALVQAGMSWRIY